MKKATWSGGESLGIGLRGAAPRLAFTGSGLSSFSCSTRPSQAPFPAHPGMRSSSSVSRPLPGREDVPAAKTHVASALQLPGKSPRSCPGHKPTAAGGSGRSGVGWLSHTHAWGCPMPVLQPEPWPCRCCKGTGLAGDVPGKQGAPISRRKEEVKRVPSKAGWGSTRETAVTAVTACERPHSLATAPCQGILPNSAQELSQRFAQISQLERS